MVNVVKGSTEKGGRGLGIIGRILFQHIRTNVVPIVVRADTINLSQHTGVQ